MRVVFANVSGYVMTTLRKAHVVDHIGVKWIFTTVHMAVQGCLKDQRDKALPAPKEGEPKNPEEESFVVTVGDEVNISNEMHDEHTMIYISTRHSNAYTLIELTEIYKRYKLNIIRTEIEKV